MKARVRAVPEKGKANAALVALIASRLGIAKSRVDVVAGTKDRLKKVRITGVDAALRANLERLMEAME